ncbi:hypothetical protein HN954_00175 [bacterium]|jgi:hypothetical protein|nr:hypothetical protein [bacterium]MBT6832052.1 hypothetical protein [bacterium]MBT6995833.1 hypothetical protein [bacterium]MBT7772356.1 hypothetical protein [bacterium]
MKYVKLIADAWELTVSHKKLVWFVFVPAIAGVLFFVAEIAWQYGLLAEEFGRLEHGFTYGTIGETLHKFSQWGILGWAIFLVVFVVLIHLVLPAWIQSTLILSVRQKFSEPTKKLSLRQKIIEGFEYFFRLFEFHAVLAPFQFMTILFYGITFYRYFHGEIYSQLLLPTLIGFIIISAFVGLFFVYAPFFMVCERNGFREAMKKSIGLGFLFFGRTAILFLLMFLVNIRVIINVLVVLGVPLGLLVMGSYFASSNWFWVAIIGGGLLGLSLFALAAYLTSLLEVFSIAFWERAFSHLRAEQMQLKTSEKEAVETISEIPDVSDFKNENQPERLVKAPVLPMDHELHSEISE